MRPFRLALATLALPLLTFAQSPSSGPAAAPSPTPSPTPWPELTRENKPWTRWWWPGSAVDRASITAQLEKLAAAGLGGVEITPIYGAKGYESRYLEFLSPPWMAMLEHTGREARRLGLGVDMATGTGWPFGGPWIDESRALQRATLRDGLIVGEPSRMMVKRAAPGGEGLVVDPYSPDALRHYLAKFEAPFAAFPRDLVRGQFHDSFEYFNASWTARLPEVFRTMHGYDIQPFAAHLVTPRPPRGSAAPPAPASTVPALDPDTLSRVKSDLRETFAALHLDYLRTWIEWSHARGWQVRNQSHGAPANLLDLYGAVDIPETETFGSTPFPIPGLRRDPADIRTGHEQDIPESLVLRVASSAAHVMGKPLVSSESATWLRDHWKVALAHVKPELDRLLADGINHIFYHGTVFSPTDAPWPGWLFYASTQFNPNNTWWDDFSALNRYIGRIQSVLQRGAPSNDLLVYWPFADVLDDPAGLMKMFGVHDVKWMTETPAGRLARRLLDAGYAFDWLSDAQLAASRPETTPNSGIHDLVTPGGGRYRAVLVPAVRRLPVATLRRLVALHRAGVPILFESLPDDVPGYGRLAERRAEFATLRARIDPAQVVPDLLADLAARAVPREPLAAAGLGFSRRVTPSGYDYFLVNLGARDFSGWIRPGAVPAGHRPEILFLDPLDGSFGFAATRRGSAGPEYFLQLPAGGSLLVRVYSPPALVGDLREDQPRTRAYGLALDELRRAGYPSWPYSTPAGPAVPLAGRWSVEFVQGGPELPRATTVDSLVSWTGFPHDPAVARFGGTARYRLEFDAPAAPADAWHLDLGDVRESARVRLNGRGLGTAWSLPYRLRVPADTLRPGRNVLEIDVTNLAANRIRDLDTRKVEWKIMREINFVNIDYKPFDASGWPLQPSGLLGPVTLTPLSSAPPR